MQFFIKDKANQEEDTGKPQPEMVLFPAASSPSRSFLNRISGSSRDHSRHCKVLFRQFNTFRGEVHLDIFQSRSSSILFRFYRTIGAIQTVKNTAHLFPSFFSVSSVARCFFCSVGAFFSVRCPLWFFLFHQVFLCFSFLPDVLTPSPPPGVPGLL